MARLRSLLLRRGRSVPFADWLGGLKDIRAAGIIRARLNRIRLGNFGDCRSVGGGVEKLRIDFGPGYRVYFARQSLVIVVLLCGGMKRTQSRDIASAQKYWKEYVDAEENRDGTISGQPA